MSASILELAPAATPATGDLLDSCVATFTDALASAAAAQIAAKNAAADKSSAGIAASVAIAYALTNGAPSNGETRKAFLATGIKQGSFKVYWGIAAKVLVNPEHAHKWHTAGRTLPDSIAEAVKAFGKFNTLKALAFPTESDPARALADAFDELFLDQQDDFLAMIGATR